MFILMPGGTGVQFNPGEGDMPVCGHIPVYPGMPAVAPAVGGPGFGGPAPVVTIDATANVVLAKFGGVGKVPNNASYTALVVVTAKNTANGATFQFLLMASIKVIAGVVTVVGSTVVSSGGDAALNTATTAVIATDAGASASVVVTGIAATNIQWQCAGSLMQN